MIKPILHKLKNNFLISILPNTNLDSVSFILSGRAGGIWEKQTELGLAHFVEHMVLEGTQKYPTSSKLSKLISDVGGERFGQGYTSFNSVSYVVKLLKEDLEKGFDYLSQLVMFPVLNPKEIEKQKSIISQEIKRTLDNPVHNFLNNSKKSLYPKDHRLTTPLIGTLDSINKFTQNDLQNYLGAYYTADNFVLGICGQVAENNILDLSHKYFSAMKTTQENSYIGYSNTNTLRVYTENRQDIKQATIVLKYDAPDANSHDRFATTFLTNILGEGDLSRLFTEIRQKRGLSYVINADYDTSPKYGELNIYVQVEESKVFEVIDLIFTEIEKIQKNSVSEPEFKRTKKHILADFIFTNEDPNSLNYFYTEAILEGRREENFDDLLEKYNKVTKEDTKTIAHKIFSKKPAILVLSNKIKSGEIEKKYA